MRQFPGLASYFERYPEKKAALNYCADCAIQLILPLYGLKQSGRNWQQKLKQELKELGFVYTLKDDTVYVNGTRSVFILSHIDDLFYVEHTQAAFEDARDALDKVVELE